MRHYYPWLVCLIAMLMLAASNGMTMTGITAFDPALLDEFGWSRGQLKFRDMFNLLLAAVLSPFIGALIDRTGVRILALCGSGLLAILYVAYSHIQTIAHIYLIHIGFALVVVSSGLSVAVVMVSQWFETRRGLALGLALTGSSLGGMLVPKVITFLLPDYGWRGSFLWMALIPVALFILCLALVRTPQVKGLRPWGYGQAERHDKTSNSGQHWPDLSYRQALRTRTFWALTVVAVTTFWGIMALSSHLILHMTDLGFNGQQAANGMLILFGLGLAGKCLFGFLADLVASKKVFVSNVALMMAGALLIAAQSVKLLWMGLVIMGLGWGGLYAVLQLQIVQAFGLSSVGKILGTIQLLDAAAVGLGVWLTALMFDHYGNYHLAFIVSAALVMIGLIAACFVRNERKLACAETTHS